MCFGNIDRLRHNLQEIYGAIRTSTSPQTELVANSSGSYIYSSSNVWGRLWRCYYALVDLFLGADARGNALKKAVNRTHTLFLEQLELVKPFLEQYQNYLRRLSSDYPIDEADYMVARNTLRRWSESTQPFVNLIKHLPSRIPDSWLITNQFKSVLPVTQEIKRCQRIIDLEGETGAALPLMIFKKVLKGKVLNPIDHKQFDQWVKKVNQRDVSVNILHKAIAALASQFQTEYVPLESFLFEKGCKVFLKPDPELMKWREQLVFGAELHDGEDVYILGKELLKPSLAMKHLRVFSVVNQPHLIIVVPENRVSLALMNQNQKTIMGIESTQYRKIVGDGQYAIMERWNPLSSIKWNSIGECISAQDLPIARQLAAIVKLQIAANQTPKRFNPDLLIFDDQYRLKSLQPIEIGPFDFNALEEFVKVSASGNSTILKFLLKESGLSIHPVAKFYEELNLNIDQDTSVEDLSAIYGIVDPKVVDRGLVIRNRKTTEI